MPSGEIVRLIQDSEVLFILSGAGMSADSGIPTYRGEGGTWGRVEKEFDRNVTEIMTPAFIAQNPLSMWKRFSKGWKKNLSINPHAGYYILQKWIRRHRQDYFVVTSNVDRQFATAGFDEDRIYEVHGAGGYLQCSVPCWDRVWQSDYSVYDDVQELTLKNLPICPNCGAMARPNVFIFRDRHYVSKRTDAQKERFNRFVRAAQGKKSLVLEIGSGPTIKTIRKLSQKLGQNLEARILRINLHDSEIEPPHISYSETALRALQQLDEKMSV